MTADAANVPQSWHWRWRVCRRRCGLRTLICWQTMSPPSSRKATSDLPTGKHDTAALQPDTHRAGLCMPACVALDGRPDAADIEPRRARCAPSRRLSNGTQSPPTQPAAKWDVLERMLGEQPDSATAQAGTSALQRKASITPSQQGPWTRLCIVCRLRRELLP